MRFCSFLAPVLKTALEDRIAALGRKTQIVGGLGRPRIECRIAAEVLGSVVTGAFRPAPPVNLTPARLS
jgi:hypothetical protein